MVIANIDRITLDGPDDPEAAEALYYRVDAAYPQDWQEKVEVMLVKHDKTIRIAVVP